MAAQSASAPAQTSNERRARRDDEIALNPMEDIVGYARQYAKEQPEMAALWCLGLGFVLGWKLRPW